MRLTICLIFIFNFALIRAQYLDVNFRSDNLMFPSSRIDGMLVNGLNASYFPSKKKNWGFNLNYSYFTTSGRSSTDFSGNALSGGIQLQKNVPLDSLFTFYWQVKSSLSYAVINQEHSNIITVKQLLWGHESGLTCGFKMNMYNEFGEYTGLGFFLSSGLLYNSVFRDEFKINSQKTDKSHSLYQRPSYWNIPIILGFSIDIK